MSHICKNLLIRCMDFRLNDEVEKWTKDSELFEGGFDIVSIAGASKNLADGNEEAKNSFLENVAVSVDLHNAKRIIIFHHSDCGAYAQSYNFSSGKEEKKKQFEDMKRSKTIIQEKHPKAGIVLVWGKLKDEKGKEIEFKII